MARVPVLIARARRHPMLTAALLAVALVAILIMAARVWITSDSGRRFVESQINGRNVAGYGRIAVAGLDGDPLSVARLNRLTITDSEGIWIEFEDVRLEWSPYRLFDRTIDIESLEIANARVVRRPVRQPQPAGEGVHWSLRLGRFSLDTISIEEGVAGVASQSSVAGSMQSDASEGSILTFALTPLGTGRDRIDLEATWGAGKQFELKLEAESPAGGTLGALAGVDATNGLELHATAAGTFDNAIGEARLTIAGNDAIMAAGKIEAGELVATARVDATGMPIPDDWRRVIGLGADVSLSATIKDGAATFLFDGQFASGDLDLAGEFVIAQRKLTGPLIVQADLSSLQPFSELPLGITLDGVVESVHDNPSFEGNVRAVNAGNPSLPFEALAGPVQVTLRGDDVSFRADLTALGALRENARAAAVMGPAPQLTARGVFTRSAGVLQLTEASLFLPRGNVSAAGTANTKDGTIDVSGAIDVELGALTDGVAGRAKGVYSAKGSPASINVSTTVGLSALSGFPQSLAPFFESASRLDVALAIEGANVTARSARFRSDGIDVRAAGALAGERAPNITFDGTQGLPLMLGDTFVDLARFQGAIARSSRGLQVSATSEGGSLKWGQRTVQNVSARADLTLSDGAISGPVEARGISDQTPVRVSGQLRQAPADMQLSELKGQIGPISFAGNVSQSSEDGLSVDVSGAANGLSLPVGSAETATFSLRAVQSDGAKLEILASVSGRGLNLEGFGPIDLIDAKVNSVGDGYAFKTLVKSSQRRRPLDVRLTGKASLEDGTLGGTLTIDGSALGSPISTRTPIVWQSGPSPALTADLALLGGTLRADMSGESRPTLGFELDALEGKALFAALGLPDVNATIGGRGSFQPMGDQPQGNFQLAASSEVSGLATSVEMALAGELDARALRLSGNAVYGGRLVLNGTGALPVRATQGRFVALNRSAPVQGMATLSGDLGALSTAAQAYDQDVGGNIQGRATVSGTLANLQVTATNQISDGKYELGLTGLHLVRLNITAGFGDGTLSVELSGSGANGGTLRANGEVRSGSGQIKAELVRLLIYERLGNRVRVSGPLAITETETERLISGTLAIDEARGSLDSLPSSRTRPLEVRWKEDVAIEEARPVLEKPLRIDIRAESSRRIFVTGRGLSSEWGIDMRATGTPTAPSLNGTATLVRGELDLAGRPFLFDRGVVRFDGPVENARVDLSAVRSVNGFSARMDMTGPPAAPRFAFTSSPELPQDEILSRLLFGRSSIDLSALEAAQLGASVARLTGQGSAFDPLGQLQAAIGLDRLSVGIDESGQTEVGVGQFIADSVYLELKSTGASGNAVALEWEPAPQIAVTSETRIDGDTRLSIRWKKDYD